jgi:Flp pilus assembly protein TadG
LTLSLLFIVLFGIIQFGIAFNRYQGLQAAAREGARIGSIAGSQNDIATRVRNAQSLFAATDVKVVVDYSTDNGSTFTNVCDDTGATPCTSTTSPFPCTTAGVGNLIRVTAKVPPPAGARANVYAILIPLWGNARITYTATGVFRCEKTA